MDGWEKNIYDKVRELENEKIIALNEVRKNIKEKNLQEISADKNKDIKGKKSKKMSSEDKKRIESIKRRYNIRIRIQKKLFLSQSTGEGLRVTLHSVIGLAKELLTNCNFKFVLTRKLNQDCLEVSNDHSY